MYDINTDIFSDIDYLKDFDEYQNLLYYHDTKFIKDTNQENLSLNKIRQIYYKRLTDCFIPKWQLECDRQNYSMKFNYSLGDSRKQLLFRIKERIDFLRDSALNIKILKKCGYVDIDNNPIDNVFYYVNKHGFRCEEFSDTDCVAFFGCSHTFGTGLDQDSIWPELVSKNLGLRCANISCPATGIDFWTMYANYFFKQEIKNCKAIVVCLPPSIRYSYYCDWYDHENPKYEYHENIYHETGTYINQMEWIRDFRNKATTNTGRVPFVNKYYDDSMDEPDWIGHNQNILLGKENCFNRSSSSVSVIQNLARSLNIPLILTSSYKLAEDFHTDDFDFARDVAHYGNRTHEKFADYITECINEKI